jgi:hypothetical protein
MNLFVVRHLCRFLSPFCVSYQVRAAFTTQQSHRGRVDCFAKTAPKNHTRHCEAVFAEAILLVPRSPKCPDGVRRRPEGHGLTTSKKTVVFGIAAGFDTLNSQKHGFSATQPTLLVE